MLTIKSKARHHYELPQTLERAVHQIIAPQMCGYVALFHHLKKTCSSRYMLGRINIAITKKFFGCSSDSHHKPSTAHPSRVARRFSSTSATAVFVFGAYISHVSKQTRRPRASYVVEACQTGRTEKTRCRHLVIAHFLSKFLEWSTLYIYSLFVSGHFVKNWKSRWFILQQDRLFYFKNRTVCYELLPHKYSSADLLK